MMAKTKIIFVQDAPPFKTGDTLETSTALANAIVGRGTAKFAEQMPEPELTPEPEVAPELAPAPAPKTKK